MKRDAELVARIGGFDPTSWFMRRDGTIIEVDDLGEVSFGADGPAKRIEQLALEDLCRDREQLEGHRGAAIAKALGLVAVPEPTDSRQRYWTSPGSDPSVIVFERQAPSAYGARDLVWSTFVSAPSEELRAVLATLK